MAGLIQRVPRGLLELLNAVSSGENPRAIADSISGIVDTLQFYALNNRQIITGANAAVVEGAQLSMTTPNNWAVLFALEANVVKTATVTALRVMLGISRFPTSTDFVAVYSEALGPFGATETGGARISWIPPYGWLLPPLTRLFTIPDIIGTDANVSMGIRAEIGNLT